MARSESRRQKDRQSRTKPISEKGELVERAFRIQWPAVAVVIVSRNRCKSLIRLLSQVRNLEYPKEKLGSFVVDSGSTDNTATTLQKRFPEVHLTIATENLGIAMGFNRGIHDALSNESGYRYIWLLDDDVILEKLTLKALVETAESDSSIAVAGSAVYDVDQPDQLVTAGFHVDWQRATIAYNTQDGKSSEAPLQVDLTAACSSLVRASLYRKFGLWDERFWLYWGDTEWCARMAKFGYKICCDTRSRVWHRNWAMVEPGFFYPFLLQDRIRGGLLFNSLHNPKRSIAGIRHLILISYLKAAMETFTRRPFFSQACIEGVQDFLDGNFSKKKFPSWVKKLAATDLDNGSSGLVGKLPKNPKIVLNQIENETQRILIKETLEKRFKNIAWEEIPPQKIIRKAHLSVHFMEYICFHVPRFIFRLPMLLKKRDLIVSSIANPDMYNIAVAHHTMFVDPSNNVRIVENHCLQATADFFRIIVLGIGVAFLQLPSALKKHESLKKAFGA